MKNNLKKIFPKLLLSTVFVFLSLLVSPNQVSATVGTWSTGASGGTARAAHTSFLYNGKIYSWGGVYGINELNTVDIYDIATDSWSTGTAGGTARYGHTSVLYNGKIYSWGGKFDSSGAILNTVDIYDIATDSWSTGTTGGTARYQSTSVLYNGKIYSWGGFNGSAYSNIMDIYDIVAGSWSTGTAGGTARYEHTSVLYNGKIYSWGGWGVMNTVDIYDIATDSWSTGTAGGTVKKHHTSVLYNGKIYSWGGWGSVTNTVDIYDIATDSWFTGTAGGTTRESHTSVLYDGKIYSWGGGGGGVYLNTVDIYDIPTKAIISFSFDGLNPVVTGVITELGTHTVTLTVPFGTNVTALVPTIVHTGASISPDSGFARNFTDPVSYTVYDVNGFTQTYMVTVTVSANPDIAAVAADKAALVDNSIKGANVDLANITVALTNPLPSSGSNGSIITWVSNTPSVVSNNGQTINRPAFSAGNASVTLTATITKGVVTDTKVFTLTVLKLPASTVATLTSGTYTVSAGGTANETITNVPFGTPKATLLAALTKVEINQTWNTTNVHNPVVTGDTLVVTAQDGTTVVTYTVTVLANISTAKAITSFVFEGLSPVATGVINEANHTIAVSVSYGTLLTALVPTITITGVSISPNSGSAQDFTNSVIYTVTAEDSSTQDYVVTVGSPTAPVITYPMETVWTNTYITILGTAGAGQTIKVYDSDNELVGGTTVLEDGTFSFRTLTLVENSTNSYHITSVDSFGSESAATVVSDIIHDDILPTVTNLDDGLSDYELPSTCPSVACDRGDIYGAQIDFSEELSSASKTAVENAITAGASVAPRTFMWSSNRLRIYSTEAIAFANDVIVSVTDFAGNTSSNLLIIDSALSENQIAPDESGDATVDDTTPEVVITKPTQEVNVNIGSDATEPKINVSSFIIDGTGTLPAINITSANANNATVAIPATTLVTSADTSWNGIIAAPTVTTVALPETTGETKTFSTAIEVGFTGAKLSFDKAVRLLLPGQAGKRAGYVRTGISFTEITSACAADDQATGNALAVDGDCKIDVGSDLAIWTKHFTSFVTYTQTTNPPSSGGGGGGGGGGYVGQFNIVFPPTLSFSINNGEAKTYSRDVNLNLQTNDQNISIMFSNSKNFEGAVWEKFVSSKKWSLPTGDGMKFVYIKFKDTYGNVNSPTFAGITLDENNWKLAAVGTSLASIASISSPAPFISSQQFIRGTGAVSFKRGLDLGSKGDDVGLLQSLLAKDSELYPEGLVTNYFGNLTKKAVGRFQLKYFLADESSSAFGYVGPMTRAKLQEVYSGDFSVGADTQIVPPSSSSDKELILKQLDELKRQLEELLKKI